MQKVVLLYQAELWKPGTKRLGVYRVCRKVKAEHEVETGEGLHLDHNTLIRLITKPRHRTKAESNASHGWLNDAKSKIV